MKIVLLLAALSAYAQTFEVVSIKPTPWENRGSVSSGGGPGTKDPGRWTCRNMTLENITWIAFGLQSEHDLAGPGWMREPRFDVVAKIPNGATRGQVSTMMQNMLFERFGLKFHKEQKEVRGYRLVVAKKGPKLTTSAPEGPKDLAARDAQPLHTVGTRVNAAGYPEVQAKWLRAPIQELVAYLGFTLGVPVVDATELTATYDFNLSWILEPSLEGTVGPTISRAMEDQIGLKLEAAKVMNTMIIVDHINRSPSEN